MRSLLSSTRLTRWVALSVIIGLGAALGLTSPANAQVPTVCTTNYSGYYCYYTGTSRGGDNWTHNACWGNTYHSYPLFLRDKVKSWDHRQSAGTYIENFNWKSSSGQWERIFTMAGQTYHSNQPLLGDGGADALRNHC